MGGEDARILSCEMSQVLHGTGNNTEHNPGKRGYWSGMWLETRGFHTCTSLQTCSAA